MLSSHKISLQTVPIMSHTVWFLCLHSVSASGISFLNCLPHKILHLYLDFFSNSNYSLKVFPDSSMCVRVLRCLVLSDSFWPRGLQPAGSSVWMILQARILEWALFPPLDDLPDAGTEPASPEAPASAGEFFTTRATWETLVCAVASVVTDSLQPYGLSPTRLLCPWDSPGKDTGVGCPDLLQRIFLTQWLKPFLLSLLY